MIVRLSDEQCEAVKQQGSFPVYVGTSQNQAEYVLLRAEDYERIRALFEDDEFDIRESYPLQEQVARAEGWDDPALDVYNDYEHYREKQ